MTDELQSMQDFLEITMSESGDEATKRGNDLAVIIARSGYLLSVAKRDLDRKMRSEALKAVEETSRQITTAKATNAIIDSLCAEERYLVNWVERINKTATHQLEWCRTVISKAKEEMRITARI